MGRARSETKEGFYYLQLSVNPGQQLIYDNRDVVELGAAIAHALGLCDASLHAYSWSPEQTHFLLQFGSKTPLWRFVQLIKSRYTCYLYQRLQKTGAVLFGPYKAVRLAEDSYLLPMMHWMHRLTYDNSAYRWSSDWVYRGKMRLAWVNTEVMMNRIQCKYGEAPNGYARWMQQCVDEQCLSEVKRAKLRVPIGQEGQCSEPEVDELTIADTRRILGEVCTLLEVTEEDLKSKSQRRQVTLGRALLAWRFAQAGGTMADAARYMGISPSAISKAVDRCVKRRRDLFKK